MDEELLIADEVGVEVFNDEVVDLVGFDGLDFFDGDRAGQAVQSFTAGKLFGHLPAVTGNPERVAERGGDLLSAGVEADHSGRGAERGAENELEGEFAGVLILCQDTIAGADRLDRRGAALGLHQSAREEAGGTGDRVRCAADFVLIGVIGGLWPIVFVVALPPAPPLARFTRQLFAGGFFQGLEHMTIRGGRLSLGVELLELGSMRVCKNAVELGLERLAAQPGIPNRGHAQRARI